MAEHFTRNTLEATRWCQRCQRFTQHRIDAGRKGPCLEHSFESPDGLSKKQRKARELRDRQHQNPSLFEGDPQKEKG